MPRYSTVQYLQRNKIQVLQLVRCGYCKVIPLDTYVVFVLLAICSEFYRQIKWEVGFDAGRSQACNRAFS
jgi:hypothetical protein